MQNEPLESILEFYKAIPKPLIGFLADPKNDDFFGNYETTATDLFTKKISFVNKVPVVLGFNSTEFGLIKGKLGWRPTVTFSKDDKEKLQKIYSRNICEDANEENYRLNAMVAGDTVSEKN